MTATALRGRTHRDANRTKRGGTGQPHNRGKRVFDVPADWVEFGVSLGMSPRNARRAAGFFIESAQTDYDFGAFRRWLDPTGETATARVLRAQVAAQ